MTRSVVLLLHSSPPLSIVGRLALAKFIGVRWIAMGSLAQFIPEPSWFQDYCEVRRLYPRMSLGSRIYFLLRFLICPFGRVESVVPKSGVVVDIGCGCGLFANLLAVRAGNRRVVGYDIDAARINIAASSIAPRGKVRFFSGQLLSRMPQCDAVTMIDVMHHMAPAVRAELLEEIARKLRPGGCLIIKDIDKKPRAKYWCNYIHDQLMTGFERCHYLDQSDMCELLSQAGFTVAVQPLKTHSPYSHVLYRCEKIGQKQAAHRSPRFRPGATKKAS